VAGDAAAGEGFTTAFEEEEAGVATDAEDVG